MATLTTTAINDRGQLVYRRCERPQTLPPAPTRPLSGAHYFARAEGELPGQTLARVWLYPQEFSVSRVYFVRDGAVVGKVRPSTEYEVAGLLPDDPEAAGCDVVAVDRWQVATGSQRVLQDDPDRAAADAAADFFAWRSGDVFVCLDTTVDDDGREVGQRRLGRVYGLARARRFLVTGFTEG